MSAFTQGERALRIAPEDNVAVALLPLAGGERALGLTLAQDIPAGHKFALAPIKEGEPVRKYGAPIGLASRDIAPGEWVHSHNLRTGLSGAREYGYQPELPPPFAHSKASFPGYRRRDGRAGIRNELWIIPTVGCVNGIAQNLANRCNTREMVADGVMAWTHPYGCSQLGGDLLTTQRLLAAMARHPNAGGVLVLGLGCENNHMAAFREVLGDVDAERVRFLSLQEVEDDLEVAFALLSDLAQLMRHDAREECDAALLTVGLKCGGSDGFSGITGNPLLGAFSDRLIAAGGSTVLTEVPEMFGAEYLLMARAEDQAVFDGIVRMINGFKGYFESHGQPVYENPSPGNKEGGITTLEEKSLGCTQKGGTGVVVDVLPYAGQVKKPGLNLLWGPGNDLCAVTALAAAGCQAILFTTGRGTPLGAPVPVIKVSTNTPLAKRKPGWIDFDAGRLLDGEGMEALSGELLARVLAVAGGERTHSERQGIRDFAIFKDGVTL